VITCLHEHAQIKDNSVKGVLTVQVIEGKMRVTTSSGTMEISKGQLVSFNPEVQHTIDALDETVLLISNSN
jgi:quercetin dioxygenase-like cupin family protein